MRCVAVMACVLVWAGCAGVSPQRVNAEFEAELNYRETAYRLKPDDVISLTVVGRTGYDGEGLRVTPDGHIDTRLGRFLVSGSTLPEAEARVAGEQREFPDAPPNVVLQLVTVAPETVWVGGEVARPGEVVLLPRMTALEAVFQAGGNRPEGKLRRVMLIRNVGDRQRSVRFVNLKRFEEDLVLLPRDIVYVPRTVVADIATFIDQYIYGLLPLHYLTPIMRMSTGSTF